MSCAAGFTHAFTPASTNAQIKMFVQKTVQTEAFEFVTSSLFQKEISIGLATSGSQN